MIILLIILLDILSKYYVVKNRIKLYNYKNKIFEIKVVKNSGAAYSLLKGRHKLLLFVTFPIIVVLVIYLFFLLRYENYILIKLSISFILGGAIGNFIDRVKQKYVIDFLYFNIKGSPIFNIADLFIIFGSLIIIWQLLFIDLPHIL